MIRMATINFYLKGALSDKKILQLQTVNPTLLKTEIGKKKLILVRIIANKHQFQKTTGLFCSQTLWDKNKMRVKSRASGMIDAIRINGKLSEIEKNISFIIEENEKFQENITIEQIEVGIAPAFVRSRKSPGFKDLVAGFIKDYSLINNKHLQINTIKKYSTLMKHIDSYHELIGHQFNIEKINEEYILNLKSFLTTDLNLNDNSSVKYIKGLKSILNYARRKRLLRSDSFNNIKVTEKEVAVIALAFEELEMLRKVKLKKASTELARDLFLFMCYTGQRYSDIQNITHEDITIENLSTIWSVRVNKTNDLIRILLSENAIYILNRYKNTHSPLPHFSNPYLNREIKVIAKLAGLNRLIKKIDYRMGKQIIHTIPLHQFISTHTARKTFVSLLLQNGISELDIRTVTGHKDNRSFARYANLKDSHCERINIAIKNLNRQSVSLKIV